MGDVGLLLSLPTESIAVRVALASVVAVVLVRLLARTDGVRTRRARASLALVPGVAVVAVLVAYAGSPDLPLLWHTIDASGGLTVPVRNTYLTFAPAAWPLIFGAWAGVTVVRVSLRVHRHVRVAAALRALAAGGDAPSRRVERIVEQLSAALRIRQPDVRVVPLLPGGGAVVGLRSPMLLLDAGLLDALDDEELAGVVAHELAHVQRRDNLVAFALCVLRDATFFVPGGGWSLQMLLREREHAADAVAADVTRRPGALAAGLLKVLESRRVGTAAAACAPLLSEGSLVARVEVLLDDRPAVTTGRRVGEGALVVGAVVVAVAAAAALPGAAAGPTHERDALGILLSDVATDATAPAGRPVVFRAFDGRQGAATTGTPVSAIATQDADLLDGGSLDHAGAAGYAACGRTLGTCRTEPPRVPLAPQPIVRVTDGLMDAWRLETIVRSDNQESALFWLSRSGAG